jgi:hypothetical protein
MTPPITDEALTKLRETLAYLRSLGVPLESFESLIARIDANEGK